MTVSTGCSDSHPLWFFSVIDLNSWYWFIWIVWSSSHDHKHTSHEAYQMLISSNRCVILWFRWSYPIPTAISVLSKSPYIVQGCHCHLFLTTIVVLLGLFSATKYYHHPKSWSLFTYGSRMINSRRWSYFVLKVILLPGKGSFENVEKPDIVLCSVARISSEYNQVWLVKQHRMAVSLTWCSMFVGNFNNFPYWAESLNVYSLRRSKILS